MDTPKSQVEALLEQCGANGSFTAELQALAGELQALVSTDRIDEKYLKVAAQEGATAMMLGWLKGIPRKQEQANKKRSREDSEPEDAQKGSKRAKEESPSDKGSKPRKEGGGKPEAQAGGLPARSVGLSNPDYLWTQFFPELKMAVDFFSELKPISQLRRAEMPPQALAKFTIRPPPLQEDVQKHLLKLIHKVIRKIETHLENQLEASHVLKWAAVIFALQEVLPKGRSKKAAVEQPVANDMVLEAASEGGSTASSTSKYYTLRQLLDHEAHLRTPGVVKGPVELQIVRYFQEQGNAAEPGPAIGPFKAGALEAAASLEDTGKLKAKVNQAIKEAAAMHYVNIKRHSQPADDRIRMMVGDASYFMEVDVVIVSNGLDPKQFVGSISASPSYSLTEARSCGEGICLLVSWLYTGEKPMEHLTVQDLNEAAQAFDADFDTLATNFVDAVGHLLYKKGLHEHQVTRPPVNSGCRSWVPSKHDTWPPCCNATSTSLVTMSKGSHENTLMTPCAFLHGHSMR